MNTGISLLRTSHKLLGFWRFYYYFGGVVTPLWEDRGVTMVVFNLEYLAVVEVSGLRHEIFALDSYASRSAGGSVVALGSRVWTYRNTAFATPVKRNKVAANIIGQ